MAELSILIAFSIRLLLVLLFFPFSALDKVLNHHGALAQAREAVSSRAAGEMLLLLGLAVEVVMSLGVLTGIADRAAALILAGYCIVTALLWKQFWKPGDFWAHGESQARGLFWTFLKNLAVAGGFLLITFGTSASSVATLFEDPLSSTNPYSLDGSGSGAE
jgi:putative oxidoreductase